MIGKAMRVGPTPPFYVSLPPEQDQGRSIRVELRDWMSSVPIDQGVAEDVLLVVSELFSNAVLATEDGAPVVVTVNVIDAGLEVVVTNQGTRFDLAQLEVPAATQQRGRGLAIAQKLGTVVVEHVHYQTSVKVRLAAGAPPAR
jgi:anti-sigma regulatory factor (Ser/Thr protein kinase)